MKLYWLADPVDGKFAHASCFGTWSYPNGDGLCKCGRIRAVRTSPLVIEWERGSNLIADFAWAPLFGLMITKETVTRLGEAGIRGVHLGPVEMKGKIAKRRSRNQVSLPYEGPALFDFMVSHAVPVDFKRSTGIRGEICEVCGKFSYTADGIERREIDLQGTRRHQRVSGMGHFVREADLMGNDLFGFAHVPDVPVATERFVEAYNALGLQNIEF